MWNQSNNPTSSTNLLSPLKATYTKQQSMEIPTPKQQQSSISIVPTSTSSINCIPPVVCKEPASLSFLSPFPNIQQRAFSSQFLLPSEIYKRMEDSVAQQPTNKAYDTNLLASPFYQHEEGNGEYEFPLKIVVNSEQNLPVQMQVPKQKYGTILEQCNSYKSCMHLQKELLLMGSGDIDMMLLEAKYEFRELLLHKYGNYFVTTLIQMCNEVQRMYFLQAIESAIVDGCMSAYGIHPLQALLSLKLTAKEVDIIRNQIQNKLCAICEVWC